MEGLTVTDTSKIGRIVAITGCQAVALVDQDPNANAGGERVSLQIASLVKMRTSMYTVFGVVTALNIPMPSDKPSKPELKLIELELIGELVASQDGRRFQRGVSIFPGLGEEVFDVTQEDLSFIYAAPNAASARIGTIHQDRSLPAYILIDELLGKHMAVLGTTGTGKSCAVALMLRAILDHHENGHVILLDMHNEYAAAFRDMAEVLNRDTFELPYWLLNFEEMEEIVLGDSREREAERPILAEVIVGAKRAFVGDTRGSKLVTVDSPVPYRLHDVERLIDQAAGRLEKRADTRSYVRLKARLNALSSDPRFAFLFPEQIARSSIESVLSQLFRIPVEGKPITIVDLSSVPSEVLNVVVSVLCRMTFDFALLSERIVPVLLVCEEAHRYCPVGVNEGFEPAKRSLAQIAKEGRKYGISFAWSVSGRPNWLRPCFPSATPSSPCA